MPVDTLVSEIIGSNVGSTGRQMGDSKEPTAHIPVHPGAIQGDT